MMELQSISSLRPTPVFASKGDASKKIRVGMPIGVSVILDQMTSYHFLDKMIQCVLPRIREWVK
jgi:ribosomal protein L5